MNTQAIVQKLWNLCHVLRDDGITYHEYVTELTFLLFLKMMKETGAEEQIPNETFISEDFNKRNRKSILKAGDVLLVQTGHVGESAIVPPEHDGHNCHAMIVISPVEEVLDGHYLSLFFGAPATQGAFSAIEKGMTLRHLNCHDVIHLATIVPPLDEQRAIVARVQTRLADLAKLTRVATGESAWIDQLNRAILAKAFRGELVPQDPNDEPAEAMLARLQSANGATLEAKKRTSAGAATR